MFVSGTVHWSLFQKVDHYSGVLSSAVTPELFAFYCLLP